jgi:hypothetical protein
MRNFQTVSGKTLAVVTSLALLAACGGGDDDPTATTSTTSTTSTTTTSTEATTTTTTSTTTTTVPGSLARTAAQLVVQHSSHCLAVASNTSGAAATQAVCSPTAPAQRWKITAAGSDYTILNNQSNLCLGVANASMTPAAAVVQLACDGAANVLWNIQPTATAGQYNIIAKHSNQCLDIFGSDLAPGTPAVQYTCSGTANQSNQRWVISGQ